ncbi:rhodanese-like domain-containing protein [Propionibacteriaceae bacterium Y2011]
MNQSHNEIPEIDPDHALTEVEAGRAALLDVREMEEWTAGHARPARHVPASLITGGDVSDLNLDADRAVITVCRSGRRSQTAAVTLAAQGISVSNLTGGMQAWEAAGHLLVTDDGHPGVVV